MKKPIVCSSKKLIYEGHILQLLQDLKVVQTTFGDLLRNSRKRTIYWNLMLL